MRPPIHLSVNPWACLGLLLAVVAALCPSAALAYPPAPHHTIYGCVRDQYGTPLTDTNAQVILQTPSSVQLQTAISPGLGYGINYALEVPMDAALTPELYQPTALTAFTQFKMSVAIGQATSFPIQMTGNFCNLGQPGKQTRLDLTLGTDANGDGLPDAWELAFLQALGLNLGLNDLNPDMDLAHNGRTLREEFLLGNSLFNPADAFTLRLVDPNGGSPVIEFTTMTGRSYTVLGSADLAAWAPMAFTLPADTSGQIHNFYYAPGISALQVQVLQPGSGPEMHFFRLVLQ